MKIACPGCNLTGNIDDATVPATGLAMTCPRCKKQFTVERTVTGAAMAGAMLDTCPACQYATFSEEKFTVCPKCGLVVADYHKQLLEARKNGQQASSAPRPAAAVAPSLSVEQVRRDEESRRKHGLDRAAEPAVDEPGRAAYSGDVPLPVFVVGWGTVIVAILLIVYGGFGIRDYLDRVQEAKAALAALEEAASPGRLFFQYLFFPALSIVYALVMLVVAVQFMALKKWCPAAMRVGGWTGFGLIAIMKTTDMLFWCLRASAGATFSYYATGLMGDILLAVLMVLPFLALAEFFQSEYYDNINGLFV